MGKDKKTDPTKTGIGSDLKPRAGTDENEIAIGLLGDDDEIEIGDGGVDEDGFIVGDLDQIEDLLKSSTPDVPTVLVIIARELRSLKNEVRILATLS